MVDASTGSASAMNPDDDDAPRRSGLVPRYPLRNSSSVRSANHVGPYLREMHQWLIKTRKSGGLSENVPISWEHFTH